MSRIVFFFLLGILAVAACAADQLEAIVLIAGDMHSAYDRTAQFVARIDRVKADNPACRWRF